MDEMKIKLSTEMMRRIVSKLLMKIIKKKLGIRTDIELQEVIVEKVGDTVQMHLDVDMAVRQKDLLKLMKVVEEGELE